MSRFAVRLVGPSGRITYLSNGREVEMQTEAARYAFADDAWQTATAYMEVARKLWPCPPIADVVDLDE